MTIDAIRSKKVTPLKKRDSSSRGAGLLCNLFFEISGSQDSQLLSNISPFPYIYLHHMATTTIFPKSVKFANTF
jgi:hypothetical protein